MLLLDGFTGTLQVILASSQRAIQRTEVIQVLEYLNLERGDLPGARPGRAARLRASGRQGFAHVALLGANQRNDIKPAPSIRVGCVVSWVAGRGRKLLALTPGGVDWF